MNRQLRFKKEVTVRFIGDKPEHEPPTYNPKRIRSILKPPSSNKKELKRTNFSTKTALISFNVYDSKHYSFEDENDLENSWTEFRKMMNELVDVHLFMEMQETLTNYKGIREWYQKAKRSQETQLARCRDNRRKEKEERKQQMKMDKNVDSVEGKVDDLKEILREMKIKGIDIEEVLIQALSGKNKYSDIGPDVLLEDDSERARERARLQIAPRFSCDEIDIISLLVEATENSIENREAGLPACGPFESVLKTMGEDGKRMEEQRDRLKDKIMDYEDRINEVCEQITSTIDDFDRLLTDLSISLNPFDCLRRLEITSAALVHENTKRKIKAKNEEPCSTTIPEIPQERAHPMTDAEKRDWVSEYHRSLESKLPHRVMNREEEAELMLKQFIDWPSQHLSTLRNHSKNLASEWPKDNNSSFFPYETAILYLIKKSNDVLLHNEMLKTGLLDLQKQFDDGQSITYSMASETSQWHTPDTGRFTRLGKTLFSPLRRLWQASKKHLRRMRSYRGC